MSPKFPKSHLYRLQPQLSPPQVLPQRWGECKDTDFRPSLSSLASSVLGPF